MWSGCRDAANVTLQDFHDEPINRDGLIFSDG